MHHTITQTLQELGFDLGKPIKPIANYVQTKTLNSSLYLSGQLPIKDNQICYQGKIGKEVSIEKAKDAAKICILNIINQLIHAVYDEHENIKSCIKLEIFLNCASNFSQHTEVSDVASDLLIQILGEKAKHSRVTIGVSSLPLNAPIEISAIFEINNNKIG